MTTFVPLLGGILSSLASKDFANAPKPAGQPPGWVFAPVWIVLYLLMGYSASLLKSVPSVFWAQLALNVIWSPLYTRGMVKEAFAVILALWVSIIVTIQEFYKVNKFAAKLLIPYLLWVTYAMYLNYNVLQK
jgi:tryptophan-rich sensory protein